jgi:hypothetical protein
MRALGEGQSRCTASIYRGVSGRGLRIAVINSQPGISADPAAPMPTWGWGEVKGPFKP